MWFGRLPKPPHSLAKDIFSLAVMGAVPRAERGVRVVGAYHFDSNVVVTALHKHHGVPHITAEHTQGSAEVSRAGGSNHLFSRHIRWGLACGILTFFHVEIAMICKQFRALLRRLRF